MEVEILASEGKTRMLEVDLEAGQTYFDLLDGLGINPETVVILRGGIPVPLDSEVMSDDDLGTIKVLRAISGG